MWILRFLFSADILNSFFNSFNSSTRSKFSLEISNLLKELSISAENKNLKIHIISPDQLEIYTDKRRLHQILVNLIGNAIKFTDEGNIIIKARLSNKKIKISIKDHGIGIKKEDLSKLFKPFSRIVDPEKSKEGSGLGLYLSKKLAKLLGGKIIVQSQYRKGSTFKLILDSIELESLNHSL